MVASGASIHVSPACSASRARIPARSDLRGAARSRKPKVSAARQRTWCSGWYRRSAQQTHTRTLQLAEPHGTDEPAAYYPDTLTATLPSKPLDMNCMRYRQGGTMSCQSGHHRTFCVFECCWQCCCDVLCQDLAQPCCCVEEGLQQLRVVGGTSTNRQRGKDPREPAGHHTHHTA